VQEKELLEECRRIYMEDWLPAHLKDDSATTHEAVVAIMQRIEAVLETSG
jgi:hypothetical protein